MDSPAPRAPYGTVGRNVERALRSTRRAMGPASLARRASGRGRPRVSRQAAAYHLRRLVSEGRAQRLTRGRYVWSR